MAMYNQMPFPPVIGLPGTVNGVNTYLLPPNVDGFIEPEPGVSTSQFEAGYTEGGRFVYGGASGVPVAVFQGVKDRNEDYLYMSFISRYDPSFDNDDYVMIVLRPNPAAGPTADDRRIDVNPVQTGAGGALPTPTDPNDNTGTPLIRTNKGPVNITYYGRSPGGTHPWTALTTTPTNITTKVRSVSTGASLFWAVEIKIPTTKALGGSSWVDLQPNFGLYFNIGQVFISGGIEMVTQFPWPIDPSNPSANMLTDPFGSGQIRDWDPPTLGTGEILQVGQANPAQGVRFYNESSGIGVLDGSGNVGSYVDMTLGHTNKFVAQLQNTSPNTAPKVRARFRIAEFGISGGLYGWDAAWADLPTPANTNPAPNAGLDIPQTTSPTGHTDIELDWTIQASDRTTFGTLNRDECLWVQLDSVATGGATAEFVEDSTRRNLTIVNLSAATLRAAVDPIHLDKAHLLQGNHELLLHVTSSPIKVVQQTPVERFLTESGFPIAATPAGIGTRIAPTPRPPMPAGGGGARDVPIVNENPILSGKIASLPFPRIPITRVATWFSTVNGYQKTAKTLTFDGRKRQVVIYAGSYAYLARHVLQAGETIDRLALNHNLSATPGIKSLGNNMYSVTVGPQQPLRLVNNLATQPIRTLPGILTKPIGILTKPVTALGNLFNRLRPGG